MITKQWKNVSVLITGGLGFIGSNLAIELVNRGAHVTILDNLAPNQGGNYFNIQPVLHKVTVDTSDVRDRSTVHNLVYGKDYIFHLARQTDHILSQSDPFPDIDVNIKGTAILLEACKALNKSARFIYVGTRGQYGNAIKLPVAEDAPTNPKGIYELTNLAGEKLVKIYNDIHGIRSVMLRLTNIYGPRAQMKSDHFGVVNWFIRQAMDKTKIRVFGDGSLKRDFVYIDDVVEAILRCAQTDACYGEIINVGDDTAATFLDLVKLLVTLVEGASWEFAPFTPERAAQEPGHFVSDITKISKLTGWQPKTSLKKGLLATIAYYKKNRTQYW